ncbi:MAG: DUF4160 domain-containing protein [Cyclobacteriaceae bacterium]
MPELSRFYGIIIYMFAKDHNPPHFHAKYGEYMGVFKIQTGELLEGKLPGRALRLIEDWVELHRDELLENWELSQSDSPKFNKIEPLQ